MTHHHPHGDDVRTAGQEALSGPERLSKMVTFWIHHNEEHGRSYRQWASQAHTLGLNEIGIILERLADEAVLPNRDLQRVLMLLNVQPASH
jgi:hypothetical protein